MKENMMSGEGLWINQKCAFREYKLNVREIAEEYARLAKDFGGLPTSRLVEIETFQTASARIFAGALPGRWFAKLDNELPISMSVKIRGALYEVLKHADALTGGNLSDRSRLSGNTVTVASTGNLGLSVGLTARKLGFDVKVYMSKDAVTWKVEMLRRNGAEVQLIDGDYTEAVRKCRSDSEAGGYYFVDDERSDLLFRGYACAALEIAEHEEIRSGKGSIVVYLPCGVGNAPAGIAAGLKALLGKRVHVFLAEPVEVPSVLVGLASGRYDAVSVYDYGRSGNTVADGLACARMSGNTASVLEECVSGIYTVSDDKMLGLLKLIGECESIRIEPSSAAALNGMGMLYYTAEGIGYLRERNIISQMDDSVHISWLTGGGLMPEEVYRQLYDLGAEKEKGLCDFL